MRVDFSFKHVDSSEALMQYTSERLEKLVKFELNPMEVKCTISMQRHERIIDIEVVEGRRKFKATATSEDFYRSVEMAVNKLWRQLSKDKRRLKAHKNSDRSTYGQIARLTPELEMNYQIENPLRKVG